MQVIPTKDYALADALQIPEQDLREGKQLQVDEIWHLRAPTEHRVGINAENLWEEIGKAAEPTWVALCDLGVWFSHPALEGRIDMERARDFDHTLDPAGLALHKDSDRGKDLFDAHGTACAGLVCGGRDPNRHTTLPKDKQFIGVAPNAKVVPIRISTNFNQKSIIEALRYASKKSQVILLPRGLPDEAEITELLKEIARILPIVCAAGNNGTQGLSYPASVEGVIAVGACNNKGYRSTYSQYGPRLDVVAPSNDIPEEGPGFTRLDAEEVVLRLREQEGGLFRRRSFRGYEWKDLREASDANKWNLCKFGELSIATTDNEGEFGYNIDPASDYCRADGNFGFGGTSAAAAQVAGIIALMIAVNRCMSGPQVRQVLRDTAKKDPYLKPELDTFENEFGQGLVDAKAAVEEARGMLKKDP
jgi:subtilisin family serine protease